MRNRLLPLFTVLAVTATAQPDTSMVRYQGGFEFHDGIYFDFRSFRENAPTVPKALLTTDQDQPVTDLRNTNGKLFYPDSSGKRTRIDLDRIWGFCDHGVVYVGAGDGFSRIGLMGSLSHLVFDATYRNLEPYMYNGNTSYTTEVERFLDMGTGAFLPVTADGLYGVIKKDAVLKEDFDALPKRKRHRPETIFLYMRRYNDRHPLYFPR
jgi:hypothetical protein